MRADNSRHLVVAAQQRSEQTRTRALRALRRLDGTGTAVTFEAVAREARWTAASSTDTTTCSRRSTRWQPSHPPPVGAPARRSPQPRCKPTCSPPTNAPPGSTPASSTSRSVSPKHSVNTPGPSPDWATPVDIDALNQQITHLEQQAIDLRLQLDERDEDLTAARATNRELMTRINAPNTNR